MASLWYGNTKYCNTMCKYSAFTSVGTPILPSLQSPPADARGFMREARSVPRGLYKKDEFRFSRKESSHKVLNKRGFVAPRSSNSSNSSGSSGDLAAQDNTTFGYTRKDVLLIGLGVTLFGIGLKSGLEVARVNPLQAGNVVQLVLVLGLTVGWISTYIFRVSNKEMTYAQQLHDYENKVMQKLLEGLTEAELEALLEQVEEEKRRLASGEQIN